MSSKSRRRVGRPSKFPPEFRGDAVAMVLDEGRSIADVGRSVGVNAGTLGNWVDWNASSAANVRGSPPTSRPTCERSALSADGTRSAQTISGLWIKETSTP